jgi:hypothetical protein
MNNVTIIFFNRKIIAYLPSVTLSEIKVYLLTGNVIKFLGRTIVLEKILSHIYIFIYSQEITSSNSCMTFGTGF